MNRLPADCALFGKEMFYGFESDMLRTPKKELNKHFPNKDKIDIVFTIFIYFLELVIMDIINNNTRFSPFNKSKYRIFMDPIDKDTFIEARKSGNYLDIDPLISDFTAYNLCIGRIEKTSEDIKQYNKKTKFYIGGKMQDIITDKINKGYKYSNG